VSSTADLVAALKAELRKSGVTYAQLARELDLAESTVKRLLAKGGELSLARIDEICRVLKLDFAELARRVAEAQPPPRALTLEQERAVVADRKLMLVAICCLSLWTFEQMLTSYRLSEAECIKHLVRLDRLGLIELKPLNRYRLKMAKGFNWRPHGPIMRFFREHAMADYFGGGFDGDGEFVTLVHGSIAASAVPAYRERLQRAAQDFAQQHLADQRLPETALRSFTLVLAMRSWLFGPFRDLLRRPDGGT
jgi:transcriptional regulator with XRE-family HTH domain